MSEPSRFVELRGYGELGMPLMAITQNADVLVLRHVERGDSFFLVPKAKGELQETEIYVPTAGSYELRSENGKWRKSFAVQEHRNLPFGLEFGAAFTASVSVCLAIVWHFSRKKKRLSRIAGGAS